MVTQISLTFWLGDTLTPFLFIIALDYALRISMDANNNLGFTISKARSRRYLAVRIPDAGYAGDLAIF